MQKVDRTLQKRYGARSMLIAIAMWLVFYVLNMPEIGRGFLLGTVFSVINFAIMGELLRRRMTLAGRQRATSNMFSLILRLVLMAIPLYVAIKTPDRFNIFAVIAGLFMTQIMILAHHILGSAFSRKEKDC